MAKSVEILSIKNSSDFKKWHNVIIDYFGSEPMMLPEYCELFSGEKDTAYLALMEFSDGVICYPFIMRPIDNNYYDITTPYGYGGPQLYGNASPDEINSFWAQFDNFLKENNVVSEFIRFALDTRFKDILYPGKIEYNRTNIVRSLNQNIDEILKKVEHKVRKNIKRAKQYSLDTVIDFKGETMDDFLELYIKTMQRRKAKSCYFFNETFYKRLCDNLKGFYAIFIVQYNDINISTELILMSKKNIYSFLGGTDDKYYYIRPNDYLKYEIIKWGIENNKDFYILGGGYEEGDGIYKYKKSFAPDGEKEFLVGKRILNYKIYEKLCENIIVNNYFPAYRAKELDQAECVQK